MEETWRASIVFLVVGWQPMTGWTYGVELPRARTTMTLVWRGGTVTNVKLGWSAGASWVFRSALVHSRMRG
jgi:hypothetical protein